jgi:hypothetical protein
MRIMVMSVVLLVGLMQNAQTALPLPTVTPFFLSRQTEDGPAFLVECRNTTSAPISSGSATWALTRSAIRIDGRALDEQGQIGPGLTTEIPPGGTWRGIIELRQALPVNSYAVAFGANTRMPTVAPLSAGRHTISVRCSGVWTADLPFYWE